MDYLEIAIIQFARFFIKVIKELNDDRVIGWAMFVVGSLSMISPDVQIADWVGQNWHISLHVIHLLISVCGLVLILYPRITLTIIALCVTPYLVYVAFLLLYLYNQHTSLEATVTSASVFILVILRRLAQLLVVEIAKRINGNV